MFHVKSIYYQFYVCLNRYNVLPFIFLPILNFSFYCYEHKASSQAIHQEPGRSKYTHTPASP